MNNLIKTVDPVVAEKLAAAGFTYMKEVVSGKTFYVFPASPRLLSILQSKFSNETFAYSNKLHF